MPGRRPGLVVFDETIMRAVDDPRPDGLAWDEVDSALRTALSSGRAVGLQMAIYSAAMG